MIVVCTSRIDKFSNTRNSFRVHYKSSHIQNVYDISRNSFWFTIADYVWEKSERTFHTRKKFCVLFGSPTRQQCCGEKLVNISQDSIYINLIFRFFAFSTPTRRFACCASSVKESWRDFRVELSWKFILSWLFSFLFVFIHRHHKTLTPQLVLLSFFLRVVLWFCFVRFSTRHRQEECLKFFRSRLGDFCREHRNFDCS